MADELDRFEALRVEQVELLEGLTDEGWVRIGDHGEHGRITIQQLAAHTAGEDADHFAQIARMIPAADAHEPDHDVHGRRSRPAGGIAIDPPFDPGSVWGERDRYYLAGSIQQYLMRGVVSGDTGAPPVLELGPSWCWDPRVGPRRER